MEKLDLKKHWDNTYLKDEKRLGWYEEVPTPSLQLIEKCNLKPSDCIVNVGVGTSTLVDELLKKGYKNIVATDISSQALQKLKKRVGQKHITYLQEDLTQPNKLNSYTNKVSLWHDRAVVHFLTDKKDQQTYFELVNKLVKPEGFVIIATFNLEGATKCSGLPVLRYNAESIAKHLGNSFQLLEHFNYIYTMPSGDKRPYVYTLFKKIK
jgi:2-polyprenyl-3-methyl-5-hydroxy-6-metoxy-1,4-benzoquinol methylase